MPATSKNKEKHEDYETFIEKFKPKKTTDDCYTPPEVYNVVLDYCRKMFDIEDADIRRPFRPGGDYQAEAADYSDNVVVIDNPPFSILAKIVRFYQEHHIKYFLFAPTLTLYSSNPNSSSICTDVKIIYKNGANVNTSFLTNLFATPQTRTEPALVRALRNVQDKKKASSPRYRYPPEVITSALFTKLCGLGVQLTIPLSECHFIRALSSQRRHRKALYGGGYIISERAAAERAAAEKAAAEKAAAEQTAAENFHVWALSEEERAICRSLNPQSYTCAIEQSSDNNPPTK